jgi:APA family basic amino acid/polyamine antiporter
LWSFIGLESACVPANEVANPKKNIPLATILGTLITAFIYITSSIAIFSLLPLDVLVNSTAPFSDAAYQVFGHFGYITMTLVAVISSIGSLNGWIMLQGQVPLAMANDNLLPKFFKKINKDSPINSILVSSTLTTLILLFSYSDSFIKTFEFLIEIAVFSTLIVYIITCFAYINKYKRLDFISFVATFYAIGMLLSIGMLENIWGFCLSLTAIPMFYLMKKTSN